MINKIRERSGLLIAIIAFSLLSFILADFLVNSGLRPKSKKLTTEVPTSSQSIVTVRSNEELNQIVQERMEEAYFEGQKDAIHGDIRIEQNADSCYFWVQSPWDSGKEPIFRPDLNCNFN